MKTNRYAPVDRVLPTCHACDMEFGGELEETHCGDCSDELAAENASFDAFPWIGMTVMIFSIVWLLWHIVFFMVEATYV